MAEADGALCAAEWTAKFQDGSGRVLAESVLRRRVFHCGIASELRATVWPFLLGVYPFHSTHRYGHPKRRRISIKEKRQRGSKAN